MTSTPDITIIAGPTAVGKSAYAITQARAKNGVIINADSVQIYADLPILSARPTHADMVTVPHELYGILDARTVCNAQDYVDRAVAAIHTAFENGGHPIVVGGTGLYLTALCDGLSPLPDVPEDVRVQARALHAQMGTPAFHAHLATLDPVMSQRLRPTDTQRLIRAAEVFMATGRSLAIWQDAPRVPPLPTARFHKILVDGPRAVLRARAQARLGAMITAGAIDEVAEFRDRILRDGLDENCPPTRALGYSAFVDYLDGVMDLDTAVASAFTQTAQYIKRQQTWFRHQMAFDDVVEIDD